MTAPDPYWPPHLLSALRLGRRLVAEVAPSRPGRRAFVDITPRTDDADRRARDAGWTRSDRARVFRLEHWEYDADRLAGHDYDIGATLLRAASAAGEVELAEVLVGWGLPAGRFSYPWRTDDPR